MVNIKLNAVEGRNTFKAKNIEIFKNKVPKLDDINYVFIGEQANSIFHDCKIKIDGFISGEVNSIFDGSEGIILTYKIGKTISCQSFTGVDSKGDPLSGFRYSHDGLTYGPFTETSAPKDKLAAGDNIQFSKASGEGQWTVGANGELTAEVPNLVASEIVSSDSYVGNFSCEVELPPPSDGAEVNLRLGPSQNKTVISRKGTMLTYDTTLGVSPAVTILAGLDIATPFKFIISMEWINDRTVEFTLSTVSGEVIVPPQNVFNQDVPDRTSDVMVRIDRRI